MGLYYLNIEKFIFINIVFCFFSFHFLFLNDCGTFAATDKFDKELTLMETTRLSSRLKRYIFASVIGNGLELYDFVIFGYFSPILSKQFFPKESTLASLINVFIIFAIGLLSRPLGAYIFGKIADQQGRKKAILLSVLLMAVSTSLIGCLPNYQMIGIMAPLLLTLLRVGQGISMGGEFTSSLSFLIEHAPPSRKGLVGAWVYAGGFLGSGFGAAVSTIVTLSTTSIQLNSWGWRLPFIFGFVIAFLGYYLRKRVDETPAFLELQRTQAIEKLPFQKVLKEHFTELLLVIGLIIPNTVFCYLIAVFLPNYLNRMMGWDYTLSLVINLIPMIILLVALPLAGHFSDVWGRKRVILIGQLLLIGLTPFVFQTISSNSFTQLLGVQVAISLALALSYGPTAALLTEMFPVRVRNSGMSISYHIGTGLFGGLTPLALTMLISYTGGVLSSTLLVMSTVFVGVVALSRIQSTSKVLLPQ